MIPSLLVRSSALVVMRLRTPWLIFGTNDSWTANVTEHPNLATALAAFQADLPPLGKDSTANAGTYSYSYADLAAVSRVVLPLLGKQGLSFSSKPTLVDGKFVLDYVLRHSSGDEDRGSYPLPSGRPQEVGSAITYARRYALMAVTGVFPAEEDDDGKAAHDTRVEPGQYWDPVEQAAERDGWEQEITEAKTLEALQEPSLERRPHRLDRLDLGWIPLRHPLGERVLVGHVHGLFAERRGDPAHVGDPPRRRPIPTGMLGAGLGL